MDQLYNMVSGKHDEESKLKTNKRSYVAADDQKLELRLAPPGGEDQSLHSRISCNNKNNTSREAKKFCQDSDPKISKSAQAPVVGWPPIRSSRKNLTSCRSSSFARPPNSESSPNDEALKEGLSMMKSESAASKQQMFVKINMEGVPIGRKINLKAYDSYEKLSFAIDELFIGLLAAQRGCSDVEKEDNKVESKSICDPLHGNGKYTLLYEDNEGDRMLVGDVPWNMFVSTAKRLRVLKSSELISNPRLRSGRQEKTPLDSTMAIGR